MKLIRAIIRPEKEEEVIEALGKEGLFSFTKMDVLGRGRQRGIQVGSTKYDELAKAMMMIAVPDDQVEKAIGIIQISARTGYFGDGKIFVSPIEATYTIRTGAKDA